MNPACFVMPTYSVGDRVVISPDPPMFVPEFQGKVFTVIGIRQDRLDKSWRVDLADSNGVKVASASGCYAARFQPYYPGIPDPETKSDLVI